MIVMSSKMLLHERVRKLLHGEDSYMFYQSMYMCNYLHVYIFLLEFEVFFLIYLSILLTDAFQKTEEV